MTRDIARGVDENGRWFISMGPVHDDEIDSLSADGAQEQAQRFTVELASLWDTDERKVITLTAYGEFDIRNQVRDQHPGWYVKRWWAA